MNYWNLGRLLATGNILLSVGAALGYLAVRDFKHAAYWFCGAAITSVVTFWM